MQSAASKLRKDVSCKNFNFWHRHCGRLEFDLAHKCHSCDRRSPEHWEASRSHVAELENSPEANLFPRFRPHRFHVALMHCIKNAHLPFEMSIATIFERYL